MRWIRSSTAVVALVATALPGVIDCHAVRSRASGGHIHVDLHIHVAPEMTVQAAHDLTHEVEGAIRCAKYSPSQ